MGTNRKAISKKLRFEVFKRDSFTCQYCGRKAPDVILECDHIVPVAEGGPTDMLNLITSCQECNRGKGKQLLTDTQTVRAQREQLDRLNSIREQTEMLIEWKKELIKIEDAQIDAVEDFMRKICGEDCYFTNSGRRSISKLISRFGLDEVFTAVQISFDRYYTGTDSSWERSFNKIGGICYNRKYRSSSTEGG